ncbi:hypothetical protein CHKEEEPN_0291 [Methylorubrum podarium]|jgi:hypothetical protein|nr:hypothetical protein CHKEEEPN_0291 [Methylorubrum podarium]
MEAWAEHSVKSYLRDFRAFVPTTTFEHAASGGKECRHP